ncbi:MAG TPA: dTMP kinase, partial [Leptolyngbyaceae cyanobacterium M65_K2018_010]|nr:dTMP kinase [Leptolyngbyaceae cyanobacterium M65_K2018_010]
MLGKLIVFEGVEGCGKSTQLKRLQTSLLGHPRFKGLQQQGLVSQVLTTREPGGTQLGLGLRRLLLDDPGAGPLADRAELLLYAADRAQHIEEVIKPALTRGSWVLCDRFTDSTVAYQGYGRGLDLDLIGQLNQVATAGIRPDLTLWLKLEVETGLARARQRGRHDRMEQANLAFHRRVQQGFEALAQQRPEGRVTIDAAPAPEVVAATIQTIIIDYLAQWYPP